CRASGKKNCETQDRRKTKQTIKHRRHLTSTPHETHFRQNGYRSHRFLSHRLMSPGIRIRDLRKEYLALSLRDEVKRISLTNWGITLSRRVSAYVGKGLPECLRGTSDNGVAHSTRLSDTAPNPEQAHRRHWLTKTSAMNQKPVEDIVFGRMAPGISVRDIQ